MKNPPKLQLFSLILCLFEAFLLILTIIRLPFFIRIIKKNFLTKKTHTIKLQKCVNIAFFEMLKDIPFVIISFFIILMAPWQIPPLLQILLNHQKRIPSFEHSNKKINVPGKRKEILMVFLKVLSYDYVNILMGFLLIFSGYKLKKAIEILKISFFVMKNDFHFKDFDLRKALFQEIVNLYEDCKAIIYLIIIGFIGFRVKNSYKRLRDFLSVLGSFLRIL